MSANMTSKAATVRPLRTTYARENCQIGAVHVGYGAFHRAHQAWHLDLMMERTGDLRWGLAAINLRAEEADSFESSQGDDGSYLLKTADATGDATGDAEYRVMHPHLAFADWGREPALAQALVADPAVHLLTVTVTESGYYLTEDGALDVDASLIADELAGGASRSVYAFLRAALNERRVANDQLITVLCCDNLRENGQVLSRAFRTYLRAHGDDPLLDWLETRASFPSSMVDRITPRPPGNLAALGASATGEQQRPTVLAEDFAQWVIEDDFRGERPPLAASGAQLVTSIAAYEEAKIRILNGGHSALAYLGALAGYTTFDELMRDTELLAHLRDFECNEVIPALKGHYPGEDYPFSLSDYAPRIEQRFANPHIADTVERICMDGVNKVRIFLLPTVQGCLQHGIRPEKTYRSLAAWVHFVRAVRAGTMRARYIDPDIAAIAEDFAPGRETALAGRTALWGTLPAQHSSFISDFVDAINQFKLRGNA
jgi:D-arabinitol 4-dehydrogenase